MTVESRQRFAEVVRAPRVDLALACLLVGGEVDPDLDIGAGLARLDALAETVDVDGADPPAVAAARLRVALGEQAGYGSGTRLAATVYADVRSSLLHEVLRRGTGLPLTLSVLWVAVAERAGIQAAPVALPGHVVVAVGANEPVHVDPFAGGALLATSHLAGLVGAATGGPLRPEHLVPAHPVDLLLRLLTNVRALAARQGRTLTAARTQLWAVELSLLLPRHPLALRRERGGLLVRLGDHRGGADELERYAEVVSGADPADADLARREAGMARARLN